MSKWHRIHRPLKHGDGHRIARSDDGQISIYDYSGSNPSVTDDGPLVVMPNTIVRATFSKNYGIEYVVPVVATCDPTREARVHISTETMRALSKVVPVKVEYDPTFVALRDEVHFAGLLSPAYA